MSEASYSAAARGGIPQEELAAMAREQERRRHSRSLSREEIRLRRLIAWLCIAALLVAGALGVFLIEILMREDTQRRLALERERAIIQSELAEQKAALEREAMVSNLAAASLQRFAAEFRKSDLQTRLDVAAYYAELAPDEATAARWREITGYLQSLLAERTGEYEKVQAAIGANRQRYVAAVNEIVAAGGSDTVARERLLALDGEGAALMARAARIGRDLGLPALSNDPEAVDSASTAEDQATKLLAAGPPAPTPLAPRDGTVFAYNPRKTTLIAWTPIDGAESYTLEVDCFDCCDKARWCSDVGSEYLTVPNLDMPRFTFEFAGNKQGRWRVWSVSPDGESGPKSDWSEFTFAK